MSKLCSTRMGAKTGRSGLKAFPRAKQIYLEFDDWTDRRLWKSLSHQTRNWRSSVEFVCVGIDCRPAHWEVTGLARDRGYVLDPSYYPARTALAHRTRPAWRP